jgi:hypothetical protein
LNLFEIFSLPVKRKRLNLFVSFDYWQTYARQCHRLRYLKGYFPRFPKGESSSRKAK